MSVNPITKKITRHVQGYWRGQSGLNSLHPKRWTVSMLQQIVNDCRDAGFDDSTELSPQISRDPTGLEAFRLTVTVDIANEVVGND
jgi:hypothetical protein